MSHTSYMSHMSHFGVAANSMCNPSVSRSSS